MGYRLLISTYNRYVNSNKGHNKLQIITRTDGFVSIYSTFFPLRFCNNELDDERSDEVAEGVTEEARDEIDSSGPISLGHSSSCTISSDCWDNDIGHN